MSYVVVVLGACDNCDIIQLRNNKTIKQSGNRQNNRSIGDNNTIMNENDNKKRKSAGTIFTFS